MDEDTPLAEPDPRSLLLSAAAQAAFAIGEMLERARDYRDHPELECWRFDGTVSEQLAEALSVALRVEIAGIDTGLAKADQPDWNDERLEERQALNQLLGAVDSYIEGWA